LSRGLLDIRIKTNESFRIETIYISIMTKTIKICVVW
jgi:hypothetical protein